MELCGFSDKQARTILKKLRDENYIDLIKNGNKSKYKLSNN